MKENYLEARIIRLDKLTIIKLMKADFQTCYDS